MSQRESPTGLTFGLIHGSWHGPESWDLVREELAANNHQVIVVKGLPTQDPESTYEDHAQTAAHVLQGQRIDVLAAHSGGAQIVPRVLELLRGNVGHVAFVSGSFGDPDPRLTPDVEEADIPWQRNSAGFRSGIVKLPDGMTIFDRSEATKFFYHDLPADEAEIALSSMRPQHRLADLPLPGPLEVPATYILGVHDRIRDHTWARAIARYAGMRLLYMEGGHSLPLSQPIKLARTLIQLATPLHIPKQRYKPSQSNTVD